MKKKVIKNKKKVSQVKKVKNARQKNPIKKESKKIQRTPSGIKNFDSLIEGGFEKGSINLLSGGPGAGKTIFAIQYLLEGIKREEPVLYITFKEKKESFYKNMLEFGWDLEKLENKGVFHFIEYSAIKVRNMLEEGGGSIESIVLTKKIKRVVIDSINAFTMLYDNDLERREGIVSLFNMLKEWGCTCLIIFEAEKDSPEELEFEADSLTKLYFLMEKNKRERSLEIVKMRGTKHAKQIYKFSIEKKGIEVNKKQFK